jgi:hypothetical protein
MMFQKRHSLSSSNKDYVSNPLEIIYEIYADFVIKFLVELHDIDEHEITAEEIIEKYSPMEINSESIVSSSHAAFEALKIYLLFKDNQHTLDVQIESMRLINLIYEVNEIKNNADYFLDKKTASRKANDAKHAVGRLLKKYVIDADIKNRKLGNNITGAKYAEMIFPEVLKQQDKYKVNVLTKTNGERTVYKWILEGRKIEK